MAEKRNGGVQCYLPVLVIVLMALAACVNGEAEQMTANAHTVGQVGSIMLVADATQPTGSKVIVATFRFHSGGVDPGEVLVAFGSANVPRTEANDFKLSLVDVGSIALTEYGIWNPRRVVVENEGLVETEEDFTT